MATLWITTREDFDGHEHVFESKIHRMYTETMTACGRLVDPEYMKIMSEDCTFPITDIKLVDYPDSSVNCRLCLRTY